MQFYKLLGWAGAVIIAVGIFMPARLAGVARYISLFTAQRESALLLLALVAVAVLLIRVENFSRLLPFAVIVLLAVGWAYQQRSYSLRAMERSLLSLTSAAADLPGVRNLSDSLSASSIWWVMIVGAMLLLFASMLAPRRS